MSTEKPKCKRCGVIAETYNWERDSSFWGFLHLGTLTHRVHRVRVNSKYYRRNSEHGSPMLVSDETWPICADCWGELIGRFMQGREVVALAERQIPEAK